MEEPKEREETCEICGEKFTVSSYISEPNCPDCFNGCSDPSYHRGEPCDRSC